MNTVKTLKSLCVASIPISLVLGNHVVTHNFQEIVILKRKTTTTTRFLTDLMITIFSDHLQKNNKHLSAPKIINSLFCLKIIKHFDL